MPIGRDDDDGGCDESREAFSFADINNYEICTRKASTFSRLTFTSRFFCLAAICEDATELPNELANEAPMYSGAARHTFDSLRPNDGSNKKIHQSKQQRVQQRLREIVFDGADGIVVTAPPVLQPRFPGKQVPPYYSIGHEGFLKTNAGRGSSWTSPNHKDNEFLPSHTIYEMPDDMIESDGNVGSSVAIECDLSCGPQEFTCKKSCSCIHEDLHCDGHDDCGPDGEDEDECVVTQDMYKKMKDECESNTLSRHVMCPNTYICIKQDWLCGNESFQPVPLAFVSHFLHSLCRRR